MQRYTIKQIWRSMKESDDGEFVRYEDVEQGDKKNAQMFKNLWIDWVNTNQEVIQARDLIDRLELRLSVLYCIIMAIMGMVVGKLIGWSLGVL
jgi:hypothetical protein